MRPSFEGFKIEAENKLKVMSLNVGVQVDAETATAYADIEAMREFASRAISTRLDADTGSATAQIAAVRELGGRAISTRLDADTSTAMAQIAAVRALAGGAISTRVGIDGSRAMGQSRGLVRSLTRVLAIPAATVTILGAPGAIANLLAVAGAAAKATHALALLPAAGFGVLAGAASLITGFSGIPATFKAMSEETKNAAENAGDVADKLNAVENAQVDVADSNRAAASAQKDLNNSYKDAARELRDMNGELDDQKLSVEDAALGVQEAAQRMQQVRADPSADSTARARADLSYRQAVARLKEQQQKTADLQADTAAANAAGIDGSDRVTEARERVVDAVEAQRRAHQSLARAEREQSVGSSSQSALDKAMAKLSPNAKELVTDIRALGPAWTEARKASQDALTDGMGEAVTNLAKVQLPGLRDGMVSINSALNSGLRASIASLSSETNKADFSKSLTNVATGFRNAARGAGPLTDALTKLITIGTDFLPRAGENFARFANDFNRKIQLSAADGSLREWIQDGIDAAKTFFGILRDVGSMTASIFRAADAGDTSKNLRLITADFAAFLKSTQGQSKMTAFFGEAREDLAQLQPLLAALPGILSAVVDGFQTWAAIMAPFLHVAAELLNAHPGLVTAAVAAYLGFRTLGPIFGGIRTQITDTNSALNRTQAAAATATSSIGAVASATGGVAATANNGHVALGRFGSSVQQLGNHVPAVASMQRAFLDSATAANRFGRTAGTAAAAASGLRSAASGAASAGRGLVSALGGPWVVAIMAVAAAAYQLNSESKAAEQHAKSLRATMVEISSARSDLVDIFASTGGEFDSSALSNVTGQVQTMKKSLEEAANARSGFLERGWEAPWSNETANKDFQADRWAGAKKIIDDLKLSDKQLAEQLGNNGAFADLSAKLQGMGQDGRYALTQMNELRQGILDARRIAQDTTPGFFTLSESVKTLANTSSTAGDKVSALKTALDVLSGKSVSAQDALARYNEQVRTTQELADNWDPEKGVGAQLVKGDEIDTTTANGKKLYDALKAIRDSTAEAAVAGNDLDPILAKNKVQFDALAAATGLDRVQIDALAASIGYLPDEIRILTKLDGATDVNQQLVVIAEQLKRNKDGITIPTKALTAEARADLDKLGVKVTEVVGKPDEIRITAPNEAAMASLQALIDKKLPDKTQTVLVAFDEKQLNVAARQALNPGSGNYTTITGGHVGGRATGGRVPSTGPGSETRDGFLAVNGSGAPLVRVDGGEWVINRNSSKQYDKELAQINAGTFQSLPGHQEGGVIGENTNTTTTNRVNELVSYARSLNGRAYDFGTYDDCSGHISRLSNVAVGREPQSGRMSTASEGEFLEALGFKSGIGASAGAFRVGWVDDPGMAGGGHTAGTLPNGVNVEAGGASQKVMYGGLAVGAGDPMFRDHAYLQMTSGGSNSTGASAATTNTETSTVTNPQAPAVGRASDTELTAEENRSAVDVANSQRNAVYANPASTDADKKAADRALQKAQNTLEAGNKSEDDSSLSLKGIFSKAGGYFADAILSGLGLENSILSENNVYNKAANSLYDQFNTNDNTLGGGYSYTPQNLPTVVTSTTTQSDAPVTDPSLSTTVPGAGPVTTGENATTASNFPAAVERWRGAFSSILSRLGKPSTWLEPGLTQMDFESDGNEKAVNENDTDGNGGKQVVKGLMQMLDTTYNENRSPLYGGGIWNGESNIASSVQYTAKRYGDATEVWGKGHGYADGGRIKGTGGKRSDGIPIWASPDEFMVNAYESVRNGDALEAINAGRWSPVSIDPSSFAPRGDSAGGGTQFITNVNEPRVADVRDLADLVERQNHVKAMGQFAAVGR
ncbi:hypothetical protein ACFWPK_22420 [Nocardia sp. NPDC058519]|uniref:hypothetical protein n=1 Tax=Nocardia sp. NPDC058519 TaxID=3346535 RepID=UPI00366698B2